VNLRVRVAEVARSQLKQFGINFENLLNHGNIAFGLAQGRDIVDATGTLERNGSENTLYGGFRTGNANLNGVIDALEDQGLVTILAEPNLTALSGKSASFLAGGEFPIQTVSDNNTVSIEYKPFGVSLNFTPTVLSKDKISLLVNPEVSELSDSTVTVNSQQVPIIDTRRATTTVELGSGQSFTIAGLLKSDRSNSINKFPGLGDLPVLGSLFRSHAFQNNQTELVIIVTPYIVRGVDKLNTLTDPTQGLGLPSDMERLLFGKLYGEYGGDPAGRKAIEGQVDSGAVPTLRGPAGYVLK
jgi:pilus assembly protein CpaC